MARQDLRPNCVTYNSLLSSFSGPDCLSYCLQVHCRIIQLGLESNVYITATLVTVYSKCSSSLEDFKKVCSVVMTCDHIAWNAVIAGYSNLGRHEEALRCFHEMKQADIDIDSYTLTSMIAARSAKKLLELWPNDPATYVLLSSVLTMEGNWDNAADLRKLMCERGLRKKPGYSWT
ncbi:hypothetical protein SADUNF_Sadunf09G0026400 [Salix dunnii]|uniref:Pentatricopeptide repeat-containing protein n=1 Tax=Salix dunnii TaxID=1413687 RepID=A0A835MVV6_9ROSI|nr:hypothetical protein SADUNF_Sadunf09G0026400 [Salix dunnii]